MSSDFTTEHAIEEPEADSVHREHGKPENQTLLILCLLFSVLAGLQIVIWRYPEEAMLDGIISGPNNTLRPSWPSIGFCLVILPLAASFCLIAAIFAFLLRFTRIEVLANKSTVAWTIVVGVELATLAYIVVTFYNLGNDVGIF